MSVTSRQQIRVLHVDDEPDFAELTETFLEREDDRFTVTTATSVDDGLDEFDDRPPDCVVSDYNMPGRDGLEFLQAVRDGHPDLPFILFTGKGTEEVASDAISAGATDYLRKRSGTEQYSLLANRILNAVTQYRSERRLRETREEYAAVFENAKNGLLLVNIEDDGFRYEQCNPRATELIGRDKADIVGRTPHGALGPENGHKVVGAYRTCIRQRDAVEYTVTLDLPVGQVTRKCEASPVESNGELTQLVVVFQDITEQRERQRDLEKAETLFQHAQDSLFLVDVTDEFVIERVNPAYEDATGVSAPDIRGRTPEQVLGEEQGTAVEARYRKCIERREPLQYAEQLQFGSEPTYWETKIAPVVVEDTVEYIAGSTRNITDRERRKTELREYETIIESLSDAVYILDEEGRFTYVNDEFVELVGYDRETILGNTPSLIKDQDAVERAEQALGRLLSSDGPDQMIFEVTIRPRDSDPVACEDHVGVLPYDGDCFEGSVGTLRDITERRERQQELQTLKTQYETLVENFPDGAVFLIDRDLEYVRARGQGLSSAGLAPEDIEGRNPHDVFPEEIADETCRYYERAFDGTASTFEQEYGGERYRIQTVPVRTDSGEVNRVLAVSQNVTGYAENGERLGRRDRQLSRLHDATRELFGADSLEQAAEIASQAAADILDLPLNGIHFYDDTADEMTPIAVSDASREVLGEVPALDDGIALDAFQEGEFQLYTDVREAPNVYNPETPIRSEMCIPIGDYGVFLVSSRQVGAFADSDVELARTLATNTTAALEQIHREEELQTRETELLRKNDRLDEFASVVSHDLRSPLTVADGHIELAREECNGDHLARAAEAIDRSQALIDDLLKLAREGEEVTGSEPVELEDVALRSWKTVETRQATLEADTTGAVRADRSRLQQLFENLYRNAVEHGGDRVTVHVGDLNGGFYVADTGSGIPESDRDEIFEAGFSTADGGTGFGLRIVEQVVEAHGWEIRVTESAQGGARFEVTGVEPGR